jgi:hypothetical protein
MNQQFRHRHLLAPLGLLGLAAFFFACDSFFFSDFSDGKSKSPSGDRVKTLFHWH